MKRFLAIFKSTAFVLAASVLLAGCLSATHPLPNRDRMKPDSPYIGYWHGLIAQSSGSHKLQIWSVFYLDGGRLTAVMSDRKAYPKEDFGQIRPDENTGIYDINTTAIDDEVFITMRPVLGTDGRDYIILKVELAGDTLSVWHITDDAVKRGLETKQLRSRGDGSLLVTSKSSDLGKWIATLTPLDYELYATLERSTLDPRSLTHHLLSIIPSEN